VKVVMSADELAKEDEKKRMKRAECRSERHHFSHRIVLNCAEHYPFCPFCPFCPHVESITYVLSIPAMRSTSTLPPDCLV
jgi:hypothetical protein